jgi:hydrogenase expression/formation protein HypD
VCVTPVEVIDRAVTLAADPAVILCSFGDMLRVPGPRHDLLAAKAAGGDVRVVYSPLDAVRLAATHPGRHVVFFTVGFETTPSATAMAAVLARRRGLTNFSLRVSHVLVPPAIEAILSAPGNRVQWFLAAGHVCTVMGYEEYEPLADEYRVPIVVTGFEPVDLLRGVLACVRQLEAGRAAVENEYARSVVREGNRPARAALRDVFRVVDRRWQGLGMIPRSGLALAGEYAAFDAERRFPLATLTAEEPAECIAGLVLRGAKKPPECPAFGTRCTPDHPLGAPMVSSEGACAAYHRYRRPQPMGGAVTQPTVVCPVPHVDSPHVLLAHGSGGRLTWRLIDEVFRPAFCYPLLDAQLDGAILPTCPHRLAFTADASVVRPLFFPGGDIGTLAVTGTVNDLAMCGARPLYLSASFVIEEGLPVEALRRVVESMKRAADAAGARVVTGDTKVVDRGKGDGLYLSTSGVGVLEHDRTIGPATRCSSAATSAGTGWR